MSSILKEFYRGNLTPAEQRTVQGSEMQRAINEMSKTAELLEKTLPPELQPIFHRLTDAHLTANAITAEAYYVEGLKTGARLILDILDDTHENLAPVHS